MVTHIQTFQGCEQVFSMPLERFNMGNRPVFRTLAKVRQFELHPVRRQNLI
jgi:hypothetical protein